MNFSSSPVAPTIQNMRLTSDTPSINGTTSTGLTLSLAANTKYTFKVYMFVDQAGLANQTINFQVHALAAGAALVWCAAVYTDVGVLGTSAGNDFVGLVEAAGSNVFTAGVGTSTIFALCEMHGLVTVGSNATTLQIDLVDTQVSDAIEAGSWIETQVIT